MSRLSVFLLCAGALVLAVATAVYVQHANIAILDPAGPVALAERNVIVITFFLCALVVVPVFVMLFHFRMAVSRRQPCGTIRASPRLGPLQLDRGDRLVARARGHHLLLGISRGKARMRSIRTSRSARERPAITVEVVALDWKWLFIYPAAGYRDASTCVEFPVGTPVISI